MNNNAVISLSNISKKYKIYNKPQDKLKEAMWWLALRKRKQYYRDFWALKEIDLEIPKGTTLGILGQNGSGKSTLLQVITGILQPTSGSVRVNGRISALLELGTGFSKEFTGRENVFMYGAIMGLSQKRMEQKFDDIADFADIGDFIEQPVKTYSSGMYLRLAFACAVNVDPDILIVDEALAVGDFKFRQKCSVKINEIQRNATVILVSHTMRDILMLCSRAVVMDRGSVLFHGAAEEAVDYYVEMMEAEMREKSAQKTAANITYVKDKKKSNMLVYGETCHNKEKIANISHRWVDESGNTVDAVDYGMTLVLEFSFKLLVSAKNLVIGLPMWDSKGNMITAFNTDMNRVGISIMSDGTVNGKLIIDNMIFNPGPYKVVLAVADAKEYLYRDFVGTFNVKEMPIYYGFITPKHSWKFYEMSHSE